MSIKGLVKKILLSAAAAATLIILNTANAYATNYYVSQSDGNDNNNGISATTPWKTLAKAGQLTYVSGDQLLLKCNDAWNEQLTLAGSGTAINPILVSSYGTGNKPMITRSDTTADKCIVINSPWGWKVTNLELGNAYRGIDCIVTETDKSYLWFENLFIHDCTAGPACTQESPVRYGISIFANYPSDKTKVCLSDITVTNCVMERCLFGVATWGCERDPNQAYRNRNLQNINVSNCTFTDMDGFGVAIANTNGGSITNCKFLHNGQSYMWCGSAAAMLENDENFTFGNNEIADTYRNALNSDGCGLDLEGYNDYVTVSNNLIHDSYGSAVMLFDNGCQKGGDGANFNTTICNNLLYNDGQGFSGYEDPAELVFASTTHQSVSCYGNIIYTRNGNSYDTSINGSTFGIDYFRIQSEMAWEFNNNGNTEGWSTAWNVSNLTTGSGYLTGTNTGYDPQIISNDNLGINITNNKIIKIMLKCTAQSGATAGTAGIYFTTNEDSGWSASKSKRFVITVNNPDYVEYTIDMTDVPGWTGTLKQLRFDNIDSISGDSTNAFCAYGGYDGRTQIKSSDTITNLSESNGTNLASSATASASSNSGNSGNAKDGDTSTLWTASGSEDEWVELDFNSNIAINKFVVQQADNSSINNYVVQYWDGSSWKDAFNGRSPIGSIKHMPIAPITTQKVRLYVFSTESGTPSIKEFSAYNVGRSGGKYWEFNTNNNNESWEVAWNVTNLNTSGGYMTGTITGYDPYLYSSDNLGINITNDKTIKIKMKNNTSDTSASFYFATYSDESFSESKKKTFTINANDANYTEYTIDMSDVSGWTGILKLFRLDPVNNSTSGSFSIDYIRILSSMISYDFSTDGNNEGWTAAWHISDLNTSGGYMTGTITGSDPYLYSADNLGIDITNNKIIKIRLKNNTSYTTASFYFVTNSDNSFSESKKKTFSIIANDADYTEYTIDMSNVFGWTGTLKRLRFDHCDTALSGSFSIDYIWVK